MTRRIEVTLTNREGKEKFTTPWQVLPNVHDFELSITSCKNILLSLLGIDSIAKEGEEELPAPDLSGENRGGLLNKSEVFYTSPYNRVTSSNKYLKRQVRRLVKMREDRSTSSYWDLSLNLMKHSTSFFLMSLHKWNPT